MATFLTTIRFTEQGIKSIGDSTKRAASFKAAAKKLGVKVVNTFWTLGPYDGLLILEAADEESVTAALLQLAMHGNVQTTTTRAFEASEMNAIIAKFSA